MQWYEKLHDYFPEHEMKDPHQLVDLLEEKDDVYHIKETDNYIILYAEFTNFIFIDYLLVTPHSRSRGIGTKVLSTLKQKGKMILLEAEPDDPDYEDTRKRLAFYKKNGFKKAERIRYAPEDLEGHEYPMHVMYWSPVELEEEIIMGRMEKACKEIHNFKSKQYYGKILVDPDTALKLKH
ncbi:GNAT family N-acetyltransferase [Paenibacillus sp. YAF4_2]|uniref:GNAT family N-acetyltransferase n=1 Tax=Paenibacillus sp. YAF4_2 TaxID=3233085 RepID=UPI003F9D5054